MSWDTSVPHTPVGNWGRAPHSRRPQYRAGRPQQVTKHDIRWLIATVRSASGVRDMCLQKLWKAVNLDLHPRTILTVLAREGYTRCKACRNHFIGRTIQEKWKSYSEEHLHITMDYWYKYLYSVECSFDTSKRGSSWVTGLSGEWFHDHCLQHSFPNVTGSVIVCGEIMYDWKSPLVFLKSIGRKGVIAKNYMEQVLEPIVAPAFSDLFRFNESSRGLYVENQAPVHGVKLVLVEVKNSLSIPLHPWPPSSPDLNLIENVWRIMKQRIKARDTFPNTIEKI